MNMERLTKRDKHGFAHYPYCFEKCDGDGIGIRCQTCDFEEKICNKLADYEDLEEQGLLLKLPCDVGETVFCIYSRWTKCSAYNEEKDEYRCQGCECACDSRKEKYISEQRAHSLDWIITNLKAFGKTVFLTEQEAQAALEKMKG